jgi:diguanylate cyclase (GGDEF)-like protein
MSLMTGMNSLQVFAGQERRDLVAREQRNTLAVWLDLHPRALAQVSGEAIGALDLTLQASRAAEERIRRLRNVTSVLKHRVVALQEQALTDTLTGAASRRALELRLVQECALLRRTGMPFAVFLLDADNLKEVNDTYGHASGDDYLRELARRLVMTVRDMDLVARLGGDEFVLVCPHATLTSAAELAGRLAIALGEDVVAGGVHTIPMSVSIGWVVAEPGATPDDLLQRADVTMYHAKAGRQTGGSAGSLPGQAVSST